MPAYPFLRQKMREYDITSRELAVIVDINIFDFLLKIWGIRQWTLTDTVSICRFFNTPDAEHLFVRNYYKQQFLENQGENYHV